MKALIFALIFALLFVAFMYLGKELFDNVSSSTVITTNYLLIISFTLIQYLLISGFIISLAACKKKGFHNLEDISDLGLIAGLIFGLVCGLVCALIVGVINGLVAGLIAGLIYALAIGLLLGLIGEFG